MAAVKRNKRWHIYFRPVEDGPVMTIGTRFRTIEETRAAETRILDAFRFGEWNHIRCDETRRIALKLHINRGWVVPPDLMGALPLVRKPKCPETAAVPPEGITIWKAAELFLTAPDVAGCKQTATYERALCLAAEYFGKNRLLSEIKIGDLKAYRLHRQAKGQVTGATVNREISALSRLYGTMQELELVHGNPCRGLKRLSEKSGLREVYLSRADVARIADECPDWYQQLLWFAYFTGMRQGEITGLRRRHVDLGARMLRLTADTTKEGKLKRIPLCDEALELLRDALTLQCVGTDHVFLVTDAKGTRPMGQMSVQNPWKRAMTRLQWPEPRPRYHDLRATWKTNARRSGMDPEIRELILGHADAGKSVIERYGHVSDEELLREAKKLTWDHGATVIQAAVR